MVKLKNNIFVDRIWFIKCDFISYVSSFISL